MMVYKTMLAAACLIGAASPAYAQDVEHPWTIGVAATVAQDSSQSQQRSGSGEVSLAYDFGGLTLGIALGASGADTPVPDVVNVVKSSSFNGAVSISTQLAGLDVSASVGYGRQSVDATARAAATAPAALANRDVLINGSITSTSVGGSIAKSFGEKLSVTPSLGISYDSTKTDVSARLPNGPRGGLGASKTQSGTTFTGGLGLTYKFSDSFSFGGSGALIVTSNAAAARFSNRRGGSYLQQPQLDEGSSQWGEASLQTNLALSKTVSLSASLGTSIGLPSRQTFGSLGLSWSF